MDIICASSFLKLCLYLINVQHLEIFTLAPSLSHVINHNNIPVGNPRALEGIYRTANQRELPVSLLQGSSPSSAVRLMDFWYRSPEGHRNCLRQCHRHLAVYFLPHVAHISISSPTFSSILKTTDNIFSK